MHPHYKMSVRGSFSVVQSLQLLLCDGSDDRRTILCPAEPLDPRCALVLDQGTCREYNIRWYYDKQANACAQFWYGGCHGNQNRFDTEDECKRTCVTGGSTGMVRLPSV